MSAVSPFNNRNVPPDMYFDLYSPRLLVMGCSTVPHFSPTPLLVFLSISFEFVAAGFKLPLPPPAHQRWPSPLLAPRPNYCPDNGAFDLLPYGYLFSFCGVVPRSLNEFVRQVLSVRFLPTPCLFYTFCLRGSYQARADAFLIMRSSSVWPPPTFSPF